MNTELQKLWHNYAFPIAVPDLPPLFVNVKPISLSVPGVVAEDAGVSVTARLDADVAVSTAKGEDGPIETPPANAPLSDTAGSLKLAVPLAIDYDTANKVANQQLATLIADHPLRASTSAGDVTITPSKVDLYPHGNGVVLGVTFAANIPGRLFDAHGTVWLTATPMPAQDGRSLRFTDVKLTRSIDNELWSAVQGVVSTELPKFLGDRLKVEFGKEIDQAVAKAKAVLADPAQTKGLVLDVKSVDVKLGKVVAADKALVAEGLLDASVDATLPAIPN